MYSQMKMGELLVLSFRAPREAMRFLLALNLGRQAVWQIFVIVTLLGAIAESFLYGMLAEVVATQGLELVEPVPFSRVALNGALLLLVAVILTYLGAGGDSDRFTDILLALSWYRGIATLIAASALLVWSVASTAALLLLVVLNLYSVWLAINFVSVALSDAPMGRTFAYLMVAFILSLVAVMAVSGFLDFLGLGSWINV